MQLSVKNGARPPSSSRVDVFVLDAHQRQAVTCTRVYGRLGLGVCTVVCEEDAFAVPASASRWCTAQATVPNYSTEPDHFVDTMLELIDRYHPRVVLPGHDGSIDVLRSRRTDIERLTALPLASEQALDIAVSKAKTLSLAHSLGIAVPRSVLVTDTQCIASAIEDIGTPAVIKPLHSWVEQGGVGTRLTSELVTSVDGARQGLERTLSGGCHALVQEWLPGRRDAVSLLYAHGRVWARFAQTSYREFPALGGVSVLCESIPLLHDIVGPAEALIRAIGLEGCSMVEFRRDSRGSPVLMEINPRIGGSVALAVRSGVNFPKLVYDWALGHPLMEPGAYQIGRRLRWLAGDIWNLKTTFNYQGLPDVLPGRQAITTFFLDFLRRPSALDLVDLTDPRPAGVELRRSLVIPFRQKLRKAQLKQRAARAERAKHVEKVVRTI